MKYLDVAGCDGGVVGSAGVGGVGDGVLERGESLLLFIVASSLFAALELLPELCNLLEWNRKGPYQHKQVSGAGRYYNPVLLCRIISVR